MPRQMKGWLNALRHWRPCAKLLDSCKMLQRHFLAERRLVGCGNKVLQTRRCSRLLSPGIRPERIKTGTRPIASAMSCSPKESLSKTLGVVLLGRLDEVSAV